MGKKNPENTEASPNLFVPELLLVTLLLSTNSGFGLGMAVVLIADLSLGSPLANAAYQRTVK